MSIFKIVSLFILMISATLKINAQSNVTQVKPDFNKLKIELKMDDQNFHDFKHNLALFNDSIKQIMNIQELGLEERKKRVKLVQQNRSQYLTKTLTKEQYEVFIDFEKEIQQSSLQHQRFERKKN